jgi:histone H3/H4
MSATTNNAPNQKKKSRSRQTKAGVTLSVARVTKMLRRRSAAKCISSRAPLFLAGALEKMVATIMEQAVENARKNQAKRVFNADVISAVRTDPDLARLFSSFAFTSHAPSDKPIKFILSADGQKKRKDDKAQRQEEKLNLAAENSAGGGSRALMP